MSRRPRQPEQTRLELLEAAADAIAEHGYHGMSLRKLAVSTGRSLGNFYNHFPSKEAVLFALQRDAFEQLITTASAAVSGLPDPVARLYGFVLQHVRYFFEHEAVMRVLVYEAAALPAAQRSEIRELKERYFVILRDILGALCDRGCAHAQPGTGCGAPPEEAELERMTYSVFGMLNWVYGWYQTDRHGGPEDVARTIHRVALCGIVSGCPYQSVQDETEARLDALLLPGLFGDAAAPRPITPPASAPHLNDGGP